MNRTRVALAVLGLLGVAGCGTDGTSNIDPNATTEAPVIVKEAAKPTLVEAVDFSTIPDIGVHDPSVIKTEVDGEVTYYIYGSHLAAAKSTDLLTWEYISNPSSQEETFALADGTSYTANTLQVDDSPLFNVYTSEIAEGIEWTGGYRGNWAANVIQAPNGKYWFYYNHCAQDNPNTEAVDEVCWHRSYLGLAESDSPEGPFVDKGVFLRSGHSTTDADENGIADELEAYPLDNGQTTYNPAVDPNVIDPTAFYDKEGKLWMVYGSYSGGIFILEMDETTGMPVAGQGYGTHLVGGDFRSIEGSYVMYSPESDYYYLMWSIAGFDVNGGYNVRVARSKNPQGPYYDKAGVDVSTIKGSNEIGTKLLGGFEFTQELGETAEAWGYQSPGHHSAFYDEETGKHIMVTHTRFPSTSTNYPTVPEAHAVRTHEMFVDRDGWLHISPQRYVELTGENRVSKEETMGYYKLIVQGNGTNTSAIRSVHIALNTDMTVTGDDPGVWFLLDPDTIRLELESGAYVGVVKWQYDGANQKLTPIISAVANDGASILATQVNPITATATTLVEIQDALVFPEQLTIDDEDFSLPTKAKDGAVITWESSDEYYIGTDGSVFIPTPDRGNQTIDLVANISLNGQTATKNISIELIARPEFKNAVAHYKFEDNVSDSLAGFADATVTTNNMLVAGGNEAYAAGQSGKAFSFDGDTGVKLPTDIITSDSYTVSFWSNPTALSTHTPALFMSPIDYFDSWITLAPSAVWFAEGTTVWSRWKVDTAWNQIATGQAVTYNDWTHYALTYGQGTMKLYINGTLAGSMPREDFFGGVNGDPIGGDFALGVNYGWDPAYQGTIDELIVYDYELSNLDINGAAMNNLTDPTQFTGFIADALDLGDLTAVKSSFTLPRVGPFVSGISWASDNETYLKVLNGQAIVTQPAPSEGDKEITLTATIKYKDLVDTKVFNVTVKSLAPAEYSFEGDLSAKDGVAADGKVTGDRIGNTGGSISYTDGVVGQALLLDGTSGVRLPDNLITSREYSISVWLKPTVMTDYTTALFGASDANWISFVPQLNNTAAGPLNSSAIWAATGGWWNDFNFGEKVFANGEWTHIVMSVNGSNANIYVDGVLTITHNETPNFFDTGFTSVWGIGVNYWDVPFNGAVDELKFFYEAVNADKVAELYSEATGE
ncbi:LamG-like jellyroll fold domain-containing protein [Catenovulum agarivorans]|uniref:LamG-like jellyroll fold domain-containing protein n=1 Tax=Catenovulum agarivorans TaxID=1172192 RepID=UPI0002E91FB9|nr:LamG-like jellyroll fold domain-containing protein [Catenovulum agarivorans]